MGRKMQQPDLALIGGGYWGKNLARNFLSLGALKVICDTKADTLANYGDEYANVDKVTDVQSVFDNQSIKRVAIAAPAALHFRLAKRAIEAGKHVFVEKPLCLSVDEGQELIDQAAKSGLTLMVGHLLQYHPCVVKMRELVSTGQLGKLFYITSNRLNLGKIRSEENALWSFAPHDISVILALAGGVPETIQCTGGSYLSADVADTTMTQLVFGSGLRAHIYVSWMNPFKEQKLTIIGSEGMVVFDDTKPWNEKLVMYREYLKWENGKTPVAQKSIAIPIVVSENEPLAEECGHFLTCSDRGDCPVTDGREGLRVLKVLDAAQRSLEKNGDRIDVEAARSVLYFAHPSATIDDGARIGKNSKIWHYCHVSSDCDLGDGCNLGQNVFVASGVKLGANVKIQNNVSIYGGTTIEDNVFLGPSCVLTNISNPRSEIVRKSIYEKTLIQRGATIGANATIVCGVTIGKYAFIAAGATVTKDVPDYALMKGTPARQCGWMSRHGHPLIFRNNTAKCPESGFEYTLKETDGLTGVVCISKSANETLDIEESISHSSYRVYRGQTQ